MEPQTNSQRRGSRRGDLWRLLALGGGVVFITVLIYYGGAKGDASFQPLRYLYFIPIGYVALNYGRQYGLGLSLLITSLFVPILATVLMDKGPTATATIELAITLLLFNALAAIGGGLADSQVLQKERYRALNHLSEQFSRELNLDELARIILVETMQVLEAESGELLLQENGGPLRLVAQEGPVPRPLDLSNETQGGPQPLHVSVTEWVRERNALIRLEYPDVDPRFRVVDTRPPLHSLIATPLRRYGIPFGVLVLYNKQIGTFYQRDAEFVEEIAVKSEMALENAQLYQTLEERVRQRTQDLFEEKNKLDVVLHSMAEALVVTNPQGEVILVNPVFGQLAGAPESEILYRPIGQVLSAPLLADLVARAAARPGSVHTVDVTMSADRVYRASGCALKPDSKVSGVVILLHDITHQVRVDRMKTQFLSTVSHELRTPLTSVFGFARLISKAFERDIAPKVPLDDHRAQRGMRRIKDNLSIIVSEGERLTRLINDVLDIAKMEAGKVEWHDRHFDVPGLVHQTVKGIRALAEEKELTLQVQVSDSLPPLWADPDRIRQVLINLISNAIKFTEQGGVTVSVRHLKPKETVNGWCPPEDCRGGVLVSVLDTGVGIAPEDTNRLFQRFQQLGDDLREKPRGTGLGLAICREIVTHYGGTIWAESTPGVGSTFRFTLPLPPAEGNSDHSGNPQG